MAMSSLRTRMPSFSHLNFLPMIVLCFQFGKVPWPCVRCRQRRQPMRKDRRELQTAGRDARKGIIKGKLQH